MARRGCRHEVFTNGIPVHDQRTAGEQVSGQGPDPPPSIEEDAPVWGALLMLTDAMIAILQACGRAEARTDGKRTVQQCNSATVQGVGGCHSLAMRSGRLGREGGEIQIAE